MQYVEMRWLWWDRVGQPPKGAIPIGAPPQQFWWILQYRERTNVHEIGLQEPIWSEWKNV